MTQPKAIDFFAGAGGLSEGLKRAGFEVVLANEINADAASTYASNHPETRMLVKDIRKITVGEIMDLIGEKPDLIAGGPPCQGFSTNGRRQPNDPRNMMIREFFLKVKGTRPNFFLMENVPGLLYMQGGRLLASLTKSFEKIGYSVTLEMLNAADFGVPQMRKRVFLLGSLCGKIDTSKLHVDLERKVTVAEAISDLDFVDAGESSNMHAKRPESAYQRQVRGGIRFLYNHEAARHNSVVTQRFSSLKPGQSSQDLPLKLRTKKRVLFRLDGSKPCRTVTTLPDDYIHYSLNRTLTVREYARLQSFNDSYVFLGPKTTGGESRKFGTPQFTQVANAIPPLLAQAVCKEILKLT